MPESTLPPARALLSINAIVLLTGWLWVSGLVLMVVTGGRWQLLSSRLYVPSMIGASAVGGLLAVVILKQHLGIMDWKGLLLGLAFGAAGLYFWGDVIFRFVNCATDRSPLIPKTSRILDRGRFKGAGYLWVDSPSPGGRVKIFVPRRLYDQTSNDVLVEVSLHAGRLGEPWCGSDAVRLLGP